MNFWTFFPLSPAFLLPPAVSSRDFPLSLPPPISGHRPNYSLGGKILANREGDYERCYREGEENYKPGYGKGMGRTFSLANFFLQNQGGKKNILNFLLFSPKTQNFLLF